MLSLEQCNKQSTIIIDHAMSNSAYVCLKTLVQSIR